MTDHDRGQVETSAAERRGTGRFDSIDQWITTAVRGWTLGASIDDTQLADLIERGRQRLGQFATSDGAVFGMTALVATWGRETAGDRPASRLPAAGRQ